MKKLILLFLFLVVLSIAVFAQSRMKITFVDSSIIVRVYGEAVDSLATLGNHHDGGNPTFVKTGASYKATVTDSRRGLSFGRVKSLTFWNLSSLPVPKNLNERLTISVKIPKGKVLIWHGKVRKGRYFRHTFPNYFVAREFPFFVVDKGKYLKRVSRFNRIDETQVVYVWGDSTGKAALPAAFTAVDTAANIIGFLAPTYWHKVVHYDDVNHLMVYAINDRMITGLEHFNSPYIFTVPSFISVDGVVHTFFHGMDGNGVGPEEYYNPDGKFHPSDELAFYEGLTTFFSMRYSKNFPAFLSALLYKAKLETEKNDLTTLGTSHIEAYYAKGYLFWLYMQQKGLNIDLFIKWLYAIELSDKPLPMKIRWADVLRWIAIYDKNLGQIAVDSYQGKYLEALEILESHGWSIIPVWEVPRWYDLYIGPYALTPGGVQLPTDNYPLTAAYPVYLVNSDGSNSPLAPDKDNLALRFIKSHPDSSFRIEFSDGTSRVVENKLKFFDGTPYFMHGTISINQSNKFFWQSLNIYLK